MVRLYLRRSRCLALALIFAHVSAAVTLFPLDVPVWIKAAGTLVLCANLIRAIYQRVLLESRHSVLEVELRKGGRAMVRTRAGGWIEAQVLGSTYVTPVLTVLNLRLAGHFRARHIVLLPDSADADSLRSARVLLRWSYRETARGPAA